MLTDKQETCGKLFQELVKKNSKLSASTAFIALAAPSFEGKTQSAFLDGDVKPLYFSFVNRVENPQSIYMNFIEISNKLKALAEEDMKTIEQFVPCSKEDSRASLQERISTTFLYQNPAIKLWSFGFLKALAENLKAKAEKNKTISWMELLAGDFDFDYEQASIEECLKRDSFKDLYLFLDEFIADDWALLLRNAARAVGMTCVVANTNSRIANVVGTSNSSRVDGPVVWSIVFTELNWADLKLLDDFFDFTGSINKICELCPRDELEAVSAFFVALKGSLKRPGIAIIIAKALKQFADENISGQFSLGTLADFVSGFLVKEFSLRKPGMVEEDDGIQGKLGLSFPQSFERVTANINKSLKACRSPDDFILDRAKLCNKADYLKHHLYYLTNPQSNDSSIFLTFGPAKTTTKSSKPLRVYCNGKLMSWTRELSHFKREDFGTLMGCLFVPVVDSVGQFLMERGLVNYARPERRTTDSHNDSLKSANSGNELEVAAATIVTESSRHEHDDQDCYTFAGQNGQDFVKNIVRNMILYLAEENEIEPLSITFDNSKLFDLGLYFQSCHVPFLYGWNRGNEVFDHLSAFNRHSFYVSKLSRSANKDEIDASMPFKYVLSTGDEHFIDSHIAIECKNFFEAADCTELCSILTKARKGTFPLSFVFAQKFSKTSQPINPKKPEVSHLTRLCKKEKINLYRVIKTDSMTFKIVPFEAKTKIVKNPNLICLLFETDRINVTQ